jgi:hypothetical protein
MGEHKIPRTEFKGNEYRKVLGKSHQRLYEHGTLKVGTLFTDRNKITYRISDKGTWIRVSGAPEPEVENTTES